MANIVPNPFLKLLFDNVFAGSDVRVLLAGTDLDMDNEDEFLDDIVTLDEAAGTGYTRKTVTSETVTQDDVNDRAEFSFDSPVEWSSPNPSVGLVAAAIFYIEEGPTEAERRIILKVDTFVLVLTGGSYDDTGHGDGNFRIEATGQFASYSHVAGTKILLLAGTGITPGLYEISSKVSDDVILLTSSAGSDSTADVDGGIPVNLDGSGPFELQIDSEGLLQATQG